MNKKLIMLLILLCASFLAVSSVSAANLENYDFDGYFSMKAPSGISFEKEINDTSENGVNMIIATYVGENIVVSYMDSPVFNSNSSNSVFQSFFEQMNLETSECYESQEGNMTILEPTTNDGTQFPLVGICNENKVLFIVGDDVGLIKEMGQSVVFK